MKGALVSLHINNRAINRARRSGGSFAVNNYGRGRKVSEVGPGGIFFR